MRMSDAKASHTTPTPLVVRECSDEAMQALQRERVKELPNIIVNECRKFDPEV